MKFKTYGDITAIIAYLQKCDLKKGFIVDISAIKKKRTLPQNALYHLYLKCICDETGNDKDDLHDYFKQQYLPVNFKTIFDTQITKETTTTTLNTVQMTEYMDKIIRFASELGIILPNPADKYYEDFVSHYIDRL